jgi:hypothetical protein
MQRCQWCNGAMCNGENELFKGSNCVAQQYRPEYGPSGQCLSVYCAIAIVGTNNTNPLVVPAHNASKPIVQGNNESGAGVPCN